MWDIFKNKFFNKDLELRIQLFNILAITGAVLGVLIAASCIITEAGGIHIFANLSASLFAVALLTYSSRTGRYQLCYLITVIVVFIFIFPVLFFTGGGFHSGMPSFFILAVIFTAIMLEGKRVFIMTLLEIIIYTGACLLAYRRPETVTLFKTEWYATVDIIIGFTVVSIVLGLTILRYIQIYQYSQKQLAEKNAALKQLDRMKTNFLSNASHELKTPLTVMSTYAQLTGKSLAKHPESEELLHHLKLIESEADRLSLMVSQILDVTSIEENSLKMNPKPCEITELVQKTLNTYYPVFGKNRNRLVFEPPEAELAVMCDPDRIMQVLVNLISNAAQHTQNGIITVSISPGQKFVTLEISDTGRGMNPEQLAHLFDRYFTSTEIETPGVGRNTGTGLGLYICKHIIKDHGGEITVTSETQKGTAVRFTLPALTLS